MKITNKIQSNIDEAITKALDNNLEILNYNITMYSEGGYQIVINCTNKEHDKLIKVEYESRNPYVYIMYDVQIVAPAQISTTNHKIV
jgi:hypothetical protein